MVQVLHHVGSSLIYSTYFGGSHEDRPRAISTGPLGDICVTGLTYSADFPLVNPIRATHSGHGDGFISRLSPDGQQLLFSTLLGGSDITTPHSMLCDPWGDVVVAGGTSAADFPVKHAFQPRFAGSSGLDDGDGFVTVIANDPQPVTPSPLALLDGRFLVEAIWSDPATRQTGTGQGAGLSAGSGYLSFFAPSNLELVVKMVDGRSVNHHFWFFYGALSTVEYWLRVIDTKTGAVRLYHNPPGRIARVADTAAFDAGGAAGQGTGELMRAAAREPAPGDAPRLDRLAGPSGACGQGTLCLQDGRFEVRVSWQVPGLGSGAGNGAPLAAGSGESGTFWFFDPNQVEVAIKILDGRALNGRFWVFYGALSDVQYDVFVTDTTTGQVKTYHNPAGTLASKADTNAF